MIIDGRKIRERIKEEIRKDVASFDHPLTLAIVVVGDDPVISGFVNVKKRFANDVGIAVVEKRFASDVVFEEFTNVLRELARDHTINGIVVQLPIPSTFDTEKVLNLIPVEKDVDILSLNAKNAFKKQTSLLLPPVAGAVREIFLSEDIRVRDKKVLVVGQGRLVGMPVAVWLRNEGAQVTVVDKPTPHLVDLVHNADIVVSGTGSPHLITSEMVKDGSVLVDGGTSEQGGVIVGDIDPRCAVTAKLFTPVPGGVGPVTVAMLFRNLVALAKNTRLT